MADLQATTGFTTPAGGGPPPRGLAARAGGDGPGPALRPFTPAPQPARRPVVERALEGPRDSAPFMAQLLAQEAARTVAESGPGNEVRAYGIVAYRHAPVSDAAAPLIFDPRGNLNQTLGGQIDVSG